MSHDKIKGTSKKPKSPRRLRPSLKKEYVDPAAYRAYKLPWSCDDCSHFERDNERCSLGYDTTYHRLAQQQSDYLLGGQYALCRSQEID